MGAALKALYMYILKKNNLWRKYTIQNYYLSYHGELWTRKFPFYSSVFLSTALKVIFDKSIFWAWVFTVYVKQNLQCFHLSCKIRNFGSKRPRIQGRCKLSGTFDLPLKSASKKQEKLSIFVVFSSGKSGTFLLFSVSAIRFKREPTFKNNQFYTGKKMIYRLKGWPSPKEGSRLQFLYQSRSEGVKNLKLEVWKRSLKSSPTPGSVAPIVVSQNFSSAT